jgi:beta-alanine--pyruvate transaminase
MAKGLTNAAVPCGAVAASTGIYDAMMDGADAPIELFHGYTYSAHPLACAAGLATLETYQEDGLFARAAGDGALLAGGGAFAAPTPAT